MKYALLTGASGQLGSAIKKALKDDFSVITTDIKGDVDYHMDITDYDQIKNTVSEIYKSKKIDVLINNAGIAVFTPMMQRTWEEFDQVMKTNVYGTFFLTREVLRYMVSGKIINIASVYGLISPDERIYGFSNRNSSEVYGMSKASIIQFTKYLATHLPVEITCNCISPGGIFNNQEHNFVSLYSEKTPLNRMANENEIANVVSFLCSDKSSYINGENIVVDGGFSVW